MLTETVLNPHDSALFWMEFVMKHRGAAHLKCPEVLNSCCLLKAFSFCVYNSVIDGCVLEYMVKVTQRKNEWNKIFSVKS